MGEEGEENAVGSTFHPLNGRGHWMKCKIGFLWGVVMEKGE